jgi:transcriptional regulator with XRE-family HTH domain
MSSDRDRDMFTILRLIKGMSHAEVARKAKMNPKTIARWRKRVEDGGTRYPSHNSMRKILQVVKCEFVIWNRETGEVINNNPRKPGKSKEQPAYLQ